MIKIIFKFKSFHSNNWKILLPRVLSKMNVLGVANSGFASLPTKIQRFTVLRGPHVDKKSREQFELKSSSKLLITKFDFNNNIDKQKAKILINFIKNSCGGVNLKITYIV